MKWEIGALKILAQYPTVPGVALSDVITELERTQAELALTKKNRDQLRADLAAANARIAALEAGQRWIPVEERLPEEGQYVLARSRSMHAQTYHSWWYSNSLRDVFARDNSHWLPLPQPPGGEE